jgi:hypothetical protein
MRKPKITQMRLLLLSGIAILLAGLGLATSNRTADGAAQSGGGVEIAVMLDYPQFIDPAIPLVVVRTVAGNSNPDANSKQQLLIKEVIVENRSMKDVSAVTLRWLITPLNSRTTALARGEFSPHVLQNMHKTLRAGQRMTLKLVHPKLFDLIQQIPNREAMGSKFAIKVGVAMVVFADGSSWKEELTDVSNKSEVSN